MIGTIAKLKQRYNPTMDASRDTELTDCLTGAASVIGASYAGHDIEQPAAAITERLDGARGANGTLFLLRRPVLYPTSFVITENGTTLTHAEGYSETADVIVADANEYRQCALLRGAGWAWGRQNVVVTYKYGWTAALAPKWVEDLVLEVAWLLFQSPAWVGKGAVSIQGKAVTFEKDLSPAALTAVRRLAA